MYLIFKMYLSFNKYYIYQLPNFKAGNLRILVYEVYAH